MQEQVAIIVGSGTSGLAIAACLSQQSIPYIILEREDCIASLWKKYSYDRLHLHLAKELCELPYMSFPASYPKYVPKNMFTQYLDEYVSHFKISPMYQRNVESAEYNEVSKRWFVKARNASSGEVEIYCAKFLVVATGETTNPYIPEVEGLNTFTGEVLHSTQFKSGKDFKSKNVLVVGSGNSGMEIALDLANHGAKTSIIVRSPIHILSQEMMDFARIIVKYLKPSLVDSLMVLLSKLVYGDLTKYGIRRPTEGPFYMKRMYGKYPLIDVGTCKKIKSGEIQVLPSEIINIRGNDIIFKNGKSHPFDTIVFCTGFKRSTNLWLKALGEQVWQAVEVGWIKPKKAPVDWDDATITAANFNSRALNALFCGVTNEEFKKISSTKVAKEAWTILETTYEGTKAVKTVKLQRLTSSFEEIRMEEDETFDEFYAKLIDIVNSAFNLGESIAESKIVRKILRSLPERFHAKITAIEEARDIDQIPLTELVGNLQTYEMGLGSMGKGGKSKNLALKGIEEDIEDSEDEDEDEDEDDDDDEDENLTFIIDEIIKLLQFWKKDKGIPPRKSKSSRKGRDEKPIIQCHECKGFGHMRIECPNYFMREKAKKSEDKGLVATWSDTENDSSDEYMDECRHVMAFAVSTDKVTVESASDSEDSSDEVLSAQKPSSDKTGLGYAVSSSPSSSMAFGSRTVVMPQFEKGNKGMKSKTVLANSKSFIRPHVCHHCGVSGHTRPNCFRLYPHKQLSKRSQVSSQGPTPLFGELLKVLSFLTQFQENFNSSMSFSSHTRTRAFSSSRPKTRAVWVRKEPKT